MIAWIGHQSQEGWTAVCDRADGECDEFTRPLPFGGNGDNKGSAHQLANGGKGGGYEFAGPMLTWLGQIGSAGTASAICRYSCESSDNDMLLLPKIQRSILEQQHAGREAVDEVLAADGAELALGEESGQGHGAGFGANGL